MDKWRKSIDRRSIPVLTKQPRYRKSAKGFNGLGSDPAIGVSKVDNGPDWTEVVPFPGPQDPIADRGQEQVEAHADGQDGSDDPLFVRLVARADVDSPIAGYESICHIHETGVMVSRLKRVSSSLFLWVVCLLGVLSSVVGVVCGVDGI